MVESAVEYLNTIVNYIFGVIVGGVLLLTIVLRIMMGKTETKDRGIARTIKKNTRLMMIIIILFMVYWIRIFLTGGLVEEGITGWKVYGFLFTVFLGISSIAFILFGLIKKKKQE